MGLGIFLLKDESTHSWNTVPMSFTIHTLPDDHVLKQPIDEFMKTICITENEAREIEQGTRQQQKSPEWFSAQIQTHIISAWRNFSSLSQKSTRCSGCETARSITVRIPSNTVGYRT